MFYKVNQVIIIIPSGKTIIQRQASNSEKILLHNISGRRSNIKSVKSLTNTNIIHKGRRFTNFMINQPRLPQQEFRIIEVFSYHYFYLTHFTISVIIKIIVSIFLVSMKTF